MNQLDNVEAPFAAFAFGNKGLRAAQPPRQVVLA